MRIYPCTSIYVCVLLCVRTAVNTYIIAFEHADPELVYALACAWPAPCRPSSADMSASAFIRVRHPDLTRVRHPDLTRVRYLDLTRVRTQVCGGWLRVVHCRVHNRVLMHAR
jgi:hypothetical protein